MRFFAPILVLSALMLLPACRTDPCAAALMPGSAVGIGGPASLDLRIVRQTGMPGKAPDPIGCADITVFSSTDYREPLFQGRVQLTGESVRIGELPAGDVDIIIDRPGHFPVKFIDRKLTTGVNPTDSRILLTPHDAKYTVPGWLTVSLRRGATLDHVAPIWKNVDGLKVHRTPGSWFELEIPIEHGVSKTRERVELLCRAFVNSPYVRDSRPMITLSTMMPRM